MNLLVTAAAAISVLTTTAAGQVVQSSASAREPEIMATGRGEARIAPTLAYVGVTVVTRARTAAEAASLNASRVASTMAALREAGLGAEHLTTMGYNLSQHYEGARNQPSGFVARNSIRAEVRRVADLGRVIDAAIAGGANEISSVQFSSDNLPDARRSAMADAVRQARADAETIARAAGGSLGRLITLSSSAAGMPPGREMYLEAAAVSSLGGQPTSIMPRDLVITAHASGRWEFIPGSSR